MKRAYQGKEERYRLCERWGKSTQKRPQGKLIWLHGVSVGETLSLLSFIQHLVKLYPDLTILLTTGTVTAAHIIRDKLPPSVIHQYMPLDVYGWVSRFLSFWKPDVIAITESEIWPNLLFLCQKKKIPIYLINARLTDRSFLKWQKMPSLAQTLFGTFSKILAQSETIAQRLRFFTSHDKVEVMPNLKFAAKPIPYDQEAYDALYPYFYNRPSFIAASTHAGEEEIILNAFKKIHQNCPNALLVLVPRHPKRIHALLELMRKYSLCYARRSLGHLPRLEHSVYIVDTLGDLNLFYALSPIALVCGSLISGIGGHNPIEPAQMGCCVLWGPWMKNAEDICAVLSDDAIQVNAENLSEHLIHLILYPDETKKKGQAIQKKVLAQKNNLKQLIQICIPHLGEPLTEKDYHESEKAL